MAIKKPAANAAKKEAPKFVPNEVKAIHPREIPNKPGSYFFSLWIDGITIHGCKYLEYTDKNGKEANFISLPQNKGKDEKYYNIVYFPIDSDLLSRIESALEDALDEG